MHIAYFTDPACPWSWALEPALRKLQVEFGGGIAGAAGTPGTAAESRGLKITYVMSGMAREFGEAATLVGESLNAAERTGMPVDPRLWLQSAPRSSYPACIAVKAAAEQGDPGPYLRRLREGFMCRRRKLDTGDALIDEARAVPGLDIERLRVDLGSHAILEAFGADLDRAAAVPAGRRAAGEQRPPLPSLELASANGTVLALNGLADYSELAAAARAAGAQPAAGDAPEIEAALRRFGTMATAEVAAVCSLPGPRAPAELWRLALQWRVKPERLGSGELWTLA